MFYRISKDIQCLISKRMENVEVSTETYVKVEENDFIFLNLEFLSSDPIFKIEKVGLERVACSLLDRARCLVHYDRDIFDDDLRAKEMSEVMDLCRRIRNIEWEIDALYKSNRFNHIYSGNAFLKWCGNLSGDWQRIDIEYDWIPSNSVIHSSPDIIHRILTLDESYVTAYLEDIQKNHPERDKVQAFLDLPTSSWKVTRGSFSELL